MLENTRSQLSNAVPHVSVRPLVVFLGQSLLKQKTRVLGSKYHKTLKKIAKNAYFSSEIEKFIISNHLLIGHRFFEKSSRKTSSLPISNLGSTLESIFQRFSDVFKNSYKNPYYLVSRIFSTPPRKVSKIVSGSENESKPSLESF